ncbi:MAG: protein kinase [Oscillospiraceae bacterium]
MIMDINEIKTKYQPVRLLDNDDKGTVELVSSGEKQFILRTMNGKISSYPALRKIASPYIPKIEYAISDGEKTVVLEEYIAGGKDISSLTAEKKIVTAFCELCDVLSVLHSRGIVHRDIKPSNILIAPDGHIRLIDFDASRYYDDSKDNDTRCLGTKGYAPPEQFGYSQTSAASDIYSLGVTLKTVLGEKADKRKYRHIIRKCTEFDPKNRYQSAASVKRALKFSGAAFFLPIVLCLAAVLSCVLYFHGNIFIGEAESVLSESVSASQSGSEANTSEARASSGTAAPLTQTTTAVPVTELTTVIPETAATSSDKDEEETETASEKTETSSIQTTETSASTSAANTTASQKKTTTAKTTTTAEKSETTVPSASETVSPSTSSSALPKDTSKILLTCITDKLKTPAIKRVEVGYNRYVDELEEPYEFVLDETVLGTWSLMNYTMGGINLYDKMNYYNLKKGAEYEDYPRTLTFNDDGSCVFAGYSKSGSKLTPVYSTTYRWTYGVIEESAVDEFFFYAKYYLYRGENGKEYIFLEQKNGDYLRTKDLGTSFCYYIYERDKEE